MIDENVTTRGQAQRIAYAEFLQTFYWDDFFTVTFRRPRREPYYALQAVWHTLERQCGVRRAFVGVEPHQSGDLHLHGIISGGGVTGVLHPTPNYYTGERHYPIERNMALPWDTFNTLFKVYGRCKVEACHSGERVSLYCAKYILKQQSRVADYYEFFGDARYWAAGKLKPVV